VDLEEQRRAIQDLVPEAIEYVAGIMRNPGRNSIARLNACRDILDRAGLRPTEVMQIEAGKSLAEILSDRRRARPVAGMLEQ
jgi:hypothetical protein